MWFGDQEQKFASLFFYVLKVKKKETNKQNKTKICMQNLNLKLSLLYSENVSTHLICMYSIVISSAWGQFDWYSQISTSHGQLSVLNTVFAYHIIHQDCNGAS